MLIKFLFVFLIVTLSGCAAYPKKNDNLLKTPIQFKSHFIDKDKTSKAETIEKVKDSLKNNGLMDNKDAAQVVENKISDEYDIIMKSRPTASMKVVSIINGVLAKGPNHNDLFITKPWIKLQSSFNYSMKNSKSLPDNGFEIEVRYKAANYFHDIVALSSGSVINDSTATLDATISGSFLINDEVIIGKISKIGYSLDSYHFSDFGGRLGKGGPYPDVVDNVLFNESAFINRFDGMSSLSTEPPADTVSELYSRMTAVINKLSRDAALAAYEKQRAQENALREQEKIKENTLRAKAEAIHKAKDEQLANAFRKTVKEGDETNCGLLIEKKNKLAKIQIKSTMSEQWIKLEEIYPSGHTCSIASASNSAAATKIDNKSDVGRKVCKDIQTTYKWAYETHSETIHLKGFLENTSSNKYQVRISGMVSGGSNNRVKGANVNRIDGDTVLENGTVIWDNASDWRACN